MKVDLLLKGGTLVDPAQHLHAHRDVAFRDGVVVDVEPDFQETDAANVLDCRNLIVAPGLIDLHVHVFSGVSHYGIEPDPTCLARGVTTVVDAGSAGADTFPGFRKYVIEASSTRIFAHLNISSMGMLNAEIGELDDIRFARVDRALAMVEQNRDVILGVKVRLTRHSLVSEASGIRPLHLAREAADAAGLPIMVHPQDAWCASLDDILGVMRRDDILTHCFHNMPCGIFDERGRIRDAVRDALERGVIFDVGHGAGSFSWHVVESALDQGMLPTTISSDLHVYNVDGPVFDLVTTASKFLHLGMPLEEVIARITSTPARIIRYDGRIGTLAAGAWGDATVFALETGEFPLVDSHGVVRTGRQRLVPVSVVRGGAVYRPTAAAARSNHH